MIIEFNIEIKDPESKNVRLHTFFSLNFPEIDFKIGEKIRLYQFKSFLSKGDLICVHEEYEYLEINEVLFHDPWLKIEDIVHYWDMTKHSHIKQLFLNEWL